MLDINTPRGAVTLEQERRLAEMIKQRWPGSCYLHTPKDKPGDVDAILAKDDLIKAVGQASCRDLTLATLRGSFSNEWLLTYDKMLKGRQLALAMCVEYWGLLYLVPDGLVLRIKMFAPERGWLVKFRVAKTETQATCNGGTAIRDNAFIDVSGADVVVEAK